MANLDNQVVARLLEEYAELLELSGENVFRVNAYRRAAKGIRNLGGDVKELWERGELESVPGVGRAIAEKVGEILRTGTLRALEDLRAHIPPEIAELMGVPFIGPKTARLLYTKFGVKSRAQLIEELRKGSLVEKGFSSKLADKILREVEGVGEAFTKMLLIEGMNEASQLIDSIHSSDEFELYVCGSIRRGKEVVGDVDVVVLPKTSNMTLTHLASKLEGGETRVKGENKLTWISPRGVQFDFRLAQREYLGAMLLYFTGSKEHNIALRTLAQRLGFKLSEYGLFERNGSRIAGVSEKEVYERLGLQFIEPELRENTGEIEAASKKMLPTLVSASDIFGDYHVHSSWSDGVNTLEEMVEEAVRQGYKYVVFTDHSKGESVANGMSEERLMKQAQAIEKLRSKYGSIEIQHGSEVDILRGGRLDYGDTTLAHLDYVVASLHRRFTSNTDVLTEAVVKALENRYVDALGHPTNRLLGRRPENGVDLARVVDAARKNSKFLEVDGQPRRMDLPSIWVKRAMEEGVRLVLSSDAHSTSELGYMMFALINARRGWASAQNIVNSSQKFLNTKI
ncbi:MAG: DNA polymerase/3'-5' exonuclease PolX [Thermoprotei archaeon]